MLNMYIHYEYDGTIMLVDDSNDENLESNINIINKFQNHLDINHIVSKGSGSAYSHINFNKSKYNSLSKFKTEFYSSSSDDDFFNPEFAKLAIPILENNLDYSNITGIDIKLYMDKEFNIYKKNFKYWPENLYDDPLDRLLSYFYNPGANHLGVGRTREFNIILKKETKNKKFFVRDEDGIFGLPTFDKEIPWVILSTIDGKSKILKGHINSIRADYISSERDTTKHLFSKNQNESYGYMNQVINNSFDSSLKTTYYELLEILNEKSKYDPDIIEDTLKRSLWAFISNQKYDYTFQKKLVYIVNKNEQDRYFDRKVFSLPKLKFFFSLKIFLFFILIFKKFKRKIANLIVKLAFLVMEINKFSLINKYINFHKKNKERLRN